MSKHENHIKYREPVDYIKMMSYINALTEKYPFLSVTSIGETILGKSIPLISLGEGKDEILYIGAHQASNWQESACLLNFINELCDIISTRSKLYFYDSIYLFKSRTISIIPMINPDGIDYNINGINEENPLFERVKKMNHGSTDLSDWDYNARGIALDENYIFCNSEISSYDIERNNGEWPESEREVGALCNFLRYNTSIRLILSMYKGESNCVYINDNDAFKNKSSRISQIFNCKACSPDASREFIHGLSGWCKANTNIPVVSLINQKNNIDPSWFSKYTNIREGLFTLPFLI